MSESLPRPEHGGNPQVVPADSAWGPVLDLATGINPWPWPVPASSLGSLGKLPYFDDGLQQAAADYYQVSPSQLLATSGSQAPIQLLPQLVAPGVVVLPGPAYEEHAYRWQGAGHHCLFFDHDQVAQVDDLISRGEVDHLVLVSPNNPTGFRYSNRDILRWRQRLPAEGMLLVDQAYADVLDDNGDCAALINAGVTLLRSTGKFFGLPGLRLGFVLGAPGLLARLEEVQGPWAVNSLAQAAGSLMLADQQWQAEMRTRLRRAAQRQGERISQVFGDAASTVVTPLFISQTFSLGVALALQQRCYSVGLSVRVYRWGEQGVVRWGLAADEEALFCRLAALAESLIASPLAIAPVEASPLGACSAEIESSGYRHAVNA